MIDDEGYRQNVGIILTNSQGLLFWGKRVGQEAWQFPQGGLHDNEPTIDALYRELHKEVGLEAKDVSIIKESEHWLSYRLPKRLVRDATPACIGQKQKWFLLKLNSSEENIKLDVSIKPEFDQWCWVNYWYPLHQVVTFKREVYRQALMEFAPVIMSLKQPGLILDPID